MSVKLRLKRMGRRHRPYFRVVAIESRNPRDGATLEVLGTYNPMEPDRMKRVELNTERIDHWLDHGAVPSDTVRDLLLKAGMTVSPTARKAARKAAGDAAAPQA